MATLDATTAAEYAAEVNASDRAQVILDALADPVYAKVYDSGGNVMGSGQMTSPWAVASGAQLIPATLDDFFVTTSGTPDGEWLLKFESGSRHVDFSFGLAGSGKEATWNLGAFEVGSRSGISDSVINVTGNMPPVWSGAPSTLTFTEGTGGTQAFASYVSDPDADAITYSLVGTSYTGISIASLTGVLTVTSSATAATRSLTIRAADPDGLYADLACSVTIEAESSDTANLFDDGFESFAVGSMTTNALYNFGSTLGNTPTIISSPTREGSRAMRAWITAGSSTRCEVYPAAMEVLGNDYLHRDSRGWGPRPWYYEMDVTQIGGTTPTPTAIKPTLTNGFWYGFSVYIPTIASGLYPIGTARRDILCQFHSERDPNGELTKNPIATLTYYEGRWRVTWRYDAAQAYDGSYDGSYSHDETDGIYAGCEESLAWNETTGLDGGFDGDRGRWTDWVFNICWDFRAGSTVGKLNVWKNGKTVVRYTGPIGYNDILGPYQKVGCYPVVGQATAPAREVYVDAIRFADPEVGSYAMVAPRGSR